MDAEEMQLITDKVIKNEIDSLIASMKVNALMGCNFLDTVISDAEISWLERHGYNVERMTCTPVHTIYRITW